MKIAIHQPNYLPYLGFFDKLKKVDIFVIYDDAQFNKGDFQHRNKIRTFHGWKWLTVPVEKKRIPVNKIRIRNEFMTKHTKWSNLHFREIEYNYKDAPYYAMYKDELETIYMNTYDKLVDLNMDIINFFINAFNIKTKVILSSELGLTSKSTERLVEIVEAFDGDLYLSGPMGCNYLDNSLFEDRDIKLEFQDFHHPAYKQCHEGFIPNMSSLDALFNIGELI